MYTFKLENTLITETVILKYNFYLNNTCKGLSFLTFKVLLVINQSDFVPFKHLIIQKILKE